MEEEYEMYRKPNPQISLLDDFYMPFGKLDADNRWVKMADQIPWDRIEVEYAKQFPSHEGQEAKPLRMALGAILIKETLGTSDTGTVQAVQENPYLQYFIGLKKWQTEPPFCSSSLSNFRKRFDAKTLNWINELICGVERPPESPIVDKSDSNNGDDSNDDDKNDPGSEGGTPPAGPKKNRGKLILDATCAPADIRYPTDVSLLNEARENLEKIIDKLHKPHKGKKPKPRTYRQQARKAYLSFAKQKKTSRKKIRKAIKKQLSYVKRDLGIIETMQTANPRYPLPEYWKKRLNTIQELYAQQKEMYQSKSHQIPSRIVSLNQPHVRPIVRGKLPPHQTEFGAKAAISIVNGYSFIEQISWDNMSEGTTLKQSVKRYKERFGVYPEAVIADQLYRNSDNLRYCKSLGIRISGPALGRKRIEQEKSEKKQSRADSRIRNSIEGKFGEGKRFYGLGRIMAHLKETSESVIVLQFIVMNLQKHLRVLFVHLFQRVFLRLKFVTTGCVG